MSTSEPIGLRSDLEQLFEELADELSPSGAIVDIVMVGGGWLLWHAARAATRDVDSARRLAPDVATAVQTVASRHDLADDWLNDRAAGFWPTNASIDECVTVYERGRLIVRTPPPDVIFAMKLYRGSPQDHEDLISLWPRCAFADPAAATAAFHAAFPHAPEDDHLASYIGEIATAAATEQISDDPPTNSA
jgi:hypothetical protein